MFQEVTYYVMILQWHKKLTAQLSDTLEHWRGFQDHKKGHLTFPARRAGMLLSQVGFPQHRKGNGLLHSF